MLLPQKWNCAKASECLSTRYCDKFRYTSNTITYILSFNISEFVYKIHTVRKYKSHADCKWIRHVISLSDAYRLNQHAHNKITGRRGQTGITTNLVCQVR